MKMQDSITEQVEMRGPDVRRLLYMLWKRAWIIVIAGVLTGLLAMIYSSCFIPRTYRAGFSAYINNRALLEEGTSTSTSDLNASKGLMYVYRDIVQSRTVLIQAAVDSGLYEMGYTLISDMVVVRVSDDAPILTVYVETQDPQLSKRLADSIAKIAPLQVAEVVTGSTMILIDAPYTPTKPASPNTPMHTVYGVLIGIMVSALVLVFIDLFHDDVHDGDDMESRYQIPVIGHIPDVLSAQKNDVKYAATPERGGRR